ncbi:MAG: spore cortex biosynthesis protein YabQ, partial [Candidatus Gallimonas sp.]
MTVGNQIYVFLSCVLCGVAGGFLYDFFFSLRLPFRTIWAKIVADLCFFVSFAGLYLFLSLLFSFPPLRIYMLAGCLFGLVLYLKSIHKI